MRIDEEFDNYDDYINEMMCGGSHIDECLTEEEFYELKKEVPR